MTSRNQSMSSVLFSVCSLSLSLLPGCGNSNPSCVAGAVCQPAASPCHLGAIACNNGVPMCVDTGGVGGDGLSCAVGKVCHAGACVACASGAPCTPQNPCGVGATDCSTGAPVCKDTGDTLPDGTACGNGGMCLAGTCSTCTQTPCNPSNVDMAMNVGPNDGGVPPAADLTMSSPLELATGLYFPNRIAAGATRVFFTDKSNSVFTIPRDQKDATPTLLVSNVPAANPLVAVGRQLFYQTASGISVINDDGTGQAMIVSVTAINPGNGAMPLPWTIANNKLFYVVPPAGCGCRTNFGGMFSCSP